MNIRKKVFRHKTDTVSKLFHSLIQPKYMGSLKTMVKFEFAQIGFDDFSAFVPDGSHDIASV